MRKRLGKILRSRSRLGEEEEVGEAVEKGGKERKMETNKEKRITV